MFMNEPSIDNKAYSLYRRAKDIEEKLPEERKAVYEKCLSKFPDIKYKNFTGLKNGYNAKKLDKEIMEYLENDMLKISKLVEEAKELRLQSDELYSQIYNENNSQPKLMLDPMVDEIPQDKYPKLSNCSIYPLRKSCNFGSNETHEWERCQYMKYDNSKSIFDSNRWYCSYKG